jgi:hypothetical protein
VLWAPTYRARYGGDYQPGRYVCHETRRQFDTPENRVLKFVVEAIATCTEAVPAPLRDGLCYFPADGGRPPIRTARRLADMQAALRHFRRHAALREVPLAARLDDLDVTRTDTSRRREYVAAALLYRRYQAVLGSDWQRRLAAVSRRVLPLPGRVLPDGDAWIRLGAALLRS